MDRPVLNRDLEQFKREQQERLEAVKAQQQKDLERMRHLLSSRISKIHEKEFEVLPQAWLMLNALRGAIAHAVNITRKSIPNFKSFTEEKLEAFLDGEMDAKRLTKSQASERRKKAVASSNITEAYEQHRLFVNYLIEHRIFMDEPLREKFNTGERSLFSALTDYNIGKDGDDRKLMHSGMKTMIDPSMQVLFDEVAQAVQKRLRYAEAE